MPGNDIHPFGPKEAKLSFEPKRKDVPTSEDQIGFPKLRDFIKKFDSEGLKLIVRSRKNMVIHENLDEVLLPQLPGLSIDIIKSSVCSEYILDDLLHRISPLDSEFPESLGTTRKKSSLIVRPWGGYSWDDGCYTGVRQITLVYDKHSKPFTAEKHGRVGGNKTAEIKLQYPYEFLISVNGHYYPVVRNGTPVIRSLTFKSIQRTFGPYRVEEGTPFTFLIEGGKVKVLRVEVIGTWSQLHGINDLNNNVMQL